MRTQRNKAQSLSQEFQSEFKNKLTLKEDIKFLLRCLAEKKKSVIEEQNKKSAFISINDI